MHYANGREARNGDKIVVFSNYTAPVVGILYDATAGGILYDATAGNDFCNGKVAVTKPNDPCPNLKECLHLDDVVASVTAGLASSSGDSLTSKIAFVPDRSKP